MAVSKHIVTLLAFAGILLPSYASAQLTSVGLFRLELRVHTANVENAGTDDEIWVQFNDSMPRYYIDAPGDDRERNEWNQYDIVTSAITSLSQIQFVRLGKAGSDAWSVDMVELYANRNDGVESAQYAAANQIYRNVFSPTFIDGDGSFSSTTTLWNVQSHATWIGANANVATLNAPFVTIRGETVRAMMAGAYGNAMSVDGPIYNYRWSTIYSPAAIVEGGRSVYEGELRLALATGTSLSSSKVTTVYSYGWATCSTPGGAVTGFGIGKSGNLIVNGTAITDAASNAVPGNMLTTIGRGFARSAAIRALRCSAGSTYQTLTFNSVGDISLSF